MKSIYLAVIAMAAAAAVIAAAADGQSATAAVDASGNLRVPADYRTRYEFLGTWAVAAEAGLQGAACRLCIARDQLSIGRHLPKLGVGMPFDAASFGASPALDAAHGRRMAIALLTDAESLTKRLEASLPADYTRGAALQTLSALQAPAASG